MERIVKKLIEEHKTISTMESCTGCGLANAITNIPNASKVIKFAAMTYDNDYKEKMGVSHDAISMYSVYSSEVAEDMAKKISDFTNSNYGVGITGKLKKADENNMAGDDDVVFISVYDRDNDFYYDRSVRVKYDTREENKQQVIDEVIDLLFEILYEMKKSAKM